MDVNWLCLDGDGRSNFDKLLFRSDWPHVRPSAGSQVQLSLAFGALTERVGSEIDLLTLVSHPEHGMSVLAYGNLTKRVWIVQERQQTSACDDRPKVDHSSVAIIPANLQHALNDGLRRNDPRNLSHPILPGFRPATHASHAASNCSR